MTTQPIANEAFRLDVRPLLAAGEEPFGLIIQSADRIPPGGTLELTAPFEPVPLYAVMRRRGFVRSGLARADAGWVVSFRETGIVPSATVGQVVARHPATAPVFGAHGLDLCCGGGKTLEFAARAHGVELDQLLRELQAAAG
ncbi:MAG: DUF542 domain-containing protein [Deltaproteobacteria bacterium]